MEEMRWSRVQALLHTALDRQPEERADLLRASCDVLALIDADGAGAPWLDKGVGQAAAGIFTEIDASGFPQKRIWTLPDQARARRRRDGGRLSRRTFRHRQPRGD